MWGLGPFESVFSATFTATVLKPFWRVYIYGRYHLVSYLSHSCLRWRLFQQHLWTRWEGILRRQKERAAPRQRNWNTGELTTSWEPQGLNFIARAKWLSFAERCARRNEQKTGENPGLLLLRLALCGVPACSFKSHWGWFSSRNTGTFRQRRRGGDAAQRATYLEDLSIAFKRHERELEQRNWIQLPSRIRAGHICHMTCMSWRLLTAIAKQVAASRYL